MYPVDIYKENSNQLINPDPYIIELNENNDNSTTNNNQEIIETIKIDNISTNYHKDNNKVIAIQGPVFEKLYRINNMYLENNNENLKLHHMLFKNILHYGYIFARMSPEHKALLVESLHAEQLTVLMCGDGANDCEALRTADIGVSLSQEEASIAAPFTSTVPNISCLLELIREGKCSLITSFQTFKYMMMYSLIQFMSVTFLFTKSSCLTDGQFLFTDIVLVFPLAFFLPMTGPYATLTKDKPIESLLSFAVISSILSHALICLGFQIGAWFFFRYVKGISDECVISEEEGVTPCSTNTIVYLVSNVQYLTSCFAFSVAKPFKKPIYTNIPLMLFIIIGFAYSAEIILGPDPLSKRMLNFVKLPQQWKFWILGIALVNFIICYVLEKVVLYFVNKCYNNSVTNSLENKLGEINYEPNLSEILTIQRKYINKDKNL